MLTQFLQPYPTILGGLLIVWALAFIIGLVAGTASEDRSRRLARPARFVMIAITLGIGLLLWLGAARGTGTPSGTGASPYARWIFIGLLCGALGDLVLADLFPLDQPIIVGMGLFGVGSVFYLLAILLVRRTLTVDPWVIFAAICLPSLLVGVWAWFYLIFNPGGKRSLNTGSLVYGLLLIGVTAQAIGITVQIGVMYRLAVGLGLFLISDLLLAQYVIRDRVLFPWIRDVVWIIYSGGQVLIALSIAEALPLL